MRVCIVIPARIGSTRLPRKMLLDVHGKPLIVRTYEAAAKFLTFDILVATDSDAIASALHKHDVPYMMTSTDCANGTERVAEVARRRKWCDTFVNVQGDEPEIAPETIEAAIRALGNNASVGTVAMPLHDPVEYSDQSVVKVRLNRYGHAMDFSRTWTPGSVRHIGVYAYKANYLAWYCRQKPDALEEFERLEQLRALAHGRRIAVGLVDNHCGGIDTEADYKSLLERTRLTYATNVAAHDVVLANGLPVA